MRNFINRLGLALTLLQNQREIEAKQYEDREDYGIKILSAHNFFNDYSYFLRQKMAQCTIEETEKVAILFDAFEQMAVDSLVETLITSAYRTPKKRWWFNVF